jgi:hypothetical protein
MTPLDWPSFLKKLEFRNLVPPVRVRYADGMNDSKLLCISRDVKDKDTGEPIELTVCYPAHRFYREIDAAWYVYTLVCMNLSHEVSECLLLDGVRIFDPHRQANGG